jgi:hypothetical protein
MHVGATRLEELGLFIWPFRQDHFSEN